MYTSVAGKLLLFLPIVVNGTVAGFILLISRCPRNTSSNGFFNFGNMSAPPDNDTSFADICPSRTAYFYYYIYYLYFSALMTANAIHFAATFLLLKSDFDVVPRLRSQVNKQIRARERLMQRSN